MYSLGGAGGPTTSPGGVVYVYSFTGGACAGVSQALDSVLNVARPASMSASDANTLPGVSGPRTEDS